MKKLEAGVGVGGRGRGETQAGGARGQVSDDLGHNIEELVFILKKQWEVFGGF